MLGLLVMLNPDGQRDESGSDEKGPGKEKDFASATRALGCLLLRILRLPFMGEQRALFRCLEVVSKTGKIVLDVLSANLTDHDAFTLRSEDLGK